VGVLPLLFVDCNILISFILNYSTEYAFNLPLVSFLINIITLAVAAARSAMLVCVLCYTRTLSDSFFLAENFLSHTHARAQWRSLLGNLFAVSRVINIKCDSRSARCSWKCGNYDTTIVISSIILIIIIRKQEKFAKDSANLFHLRNTSKLQLNSAGTTISC
jgi:hypothetical protein